MSLFAAKSKPRILLVDDDPALLTSYSRDLSAVWDVSSAGDGTTGLHAVEAGPAFAVVVSNFRMPGMDGAAFLGKVKEIAPETTRIMLTGELDLRVAVQAVNEGNIFRFLTKPCSADQLQAALTEGLRMHELTQADKHAKEQELHIAGEIQQALLFGNLPAVVSGVDFACFTQPSQGIDGDFIDVIEHRTGCFDIIVGDVMGKGLHAALIGAGTKHAFARAFGRLAIANCEAGSQEIPSPEMIVRRVHEDVGENLAMLDSFATLVYARFDLKAHKLIWVDAGHTTSLVYSAKNRCFTRLKGDFQPLGFPELKRYHQLEHPIRPGDIAFFYSDGFTERRNAEGRMFGIEGLETLIAAAPETPPKTLLEAIFKQVSEFGGNAPFTDDLTGILVKIR